MEKKKLITLHIIILLLGPGLSIISCGCSSRYYGYEFNDFKKVENVMTLSQNHKNIIYCMSDMVNGFDITSNLQYSPELSQNVTGFTNYLSVTSTNHGTNASVPNIFGGYDFNPYCKNHANTFSNINFRKYMNETISVLLDAFGKNNWELRCISNQYYN